MPKLNEQAFVGDWLKNVEYSIFFSTFTPSVILEFFSSSKNNKRKTDPSFYQVFEKIAKIELV